MKRHAKRKKKRFIREQKRLNRDIENKIKLAKEGKWSRGIFFALVDKWVQESELNPSHEEFDAWKAYGWQIARGIKHTVSYAILYVLV